MPGPVEMGTVPLPAGTAPVVAFGNGNGTLVPEMVKPDDAPAVGPVVDVPLEIGNGGVASDRGWAVEIPVVRPDGVGAVPVPVGPNVDDVALG